MPFDAAVPKVEAKCTVAGLVPVSGTFVAAHRNRVMTAYIESRPAHERRPAEWRFKPFFCRRSRWSYYFDRFYGRRQSAALCRELTEWLDMLYLPIDGSSKPPPQIVEVALHVQRQIGPKARFAVEFFDTDPILWVNVDHRRQPIRQHCLGIWDNGKVVAIAE